MIRSFTRSNNIEMYEDVSLKKYNTYRLDVKCDYLVFPKDIDEVVKLISFLKENNYKYLVLGNGSNVIFKNNRYNGVVIKLSKLDKIEFDGDKVVVGAGVALSKLANMAINNSLSGLEFSVSIPGEIGASVSMNAGAYNESFSDVFVSAKVLTPKLEIIELTNEDMDFSYRNSFIKKNRDYIVLEVVLKLKPGNKEEMNAVIEKRFEKRKATQPLEYPSAGSVFRNPEGMYAGKLIEDANLKGYSIGGAMISDMHANFIVNKDNATGEDIINLINLAKDKVKENNNIDLYLEQVIIDN